MIQLQSSFSSQTLANVMFQFLKNKHELTRLLKRECRQLAAEIVAEFPQLSPGVQAALGSWIFQMRRKRSSVTRRAVYGVARAMMAGVTQSQTPMDDMRVRDCLRYAVHILGRDQDQTTFSQLMPVLRNASPNLLNDLKAVANAAQQRFRQRCQAAIHAVDYSQHITEFVRYLSQATGYPAAPVRYDAIADPNIPNGPEKAARSHTLAFCDGHTIHLPPCFAVARSDSESAGPTELNAMFVAYYLTLHEFLHLALGSWNFSFATKRGKRIFRVLSPRRKQMKERSGFISRQVSRKLKAEGIREEIINNAKLPDLARLWNHFPNRELAQWLFNAVEDGRLESMIARNWPGLWHIHRTIQQTYTSEMQAAAALNSPEANLINAIGMTAAQRLVRVQITPDDQEAFSKAQKVLRRLRKLPRRSVYDSILATIKLYQILEDRHEDLTLPPFNVFQPPVDGEEIALRLQLSNQKDDPEAYRSANGDFSDTYEVKDQGIWLPEWDGTQLQEDATHVSLKKHRPAIQKNALPALTNPFPFIELPVHRTRAKGRRQWNPSGPHLAFERLATVAPYQRLGLTPPPVSYRLSENKVSIKVTMLIDLSISMEAPRHCLHGDTPFARAIQGSQWMAQRLENMGVEVEAYGAVDGGRRLCRMVQVPQPVSQHLSTLRCVGAGGFRSGAFLRAIAAHPAELNMKPFSGRHVVMMFTDTDRGYLTMSIESLYRSLQDSNCGNCASRHRCKVEYGHGAVNPRYEYSTNGHMPDKYELDDLENAVSMSDLEVIVNYFGPKMPYVGNRKISYREFLCNSANIWPAVVAEAFQPQEPRAIT